MSGLVQAAKQMKVGEMILAPGYTLHDSMTALELMAPKMDRGMHLQNYVTVESRHEKGELAIPPTHAHTAIALLDYLFRMEVAWYSGFPVISTVYTCVFAHPYSAQVLAEHAKPYLDTLESPLESAPRPHKEDSSCLALVLHAVFVLIFKTSALVHRLVRHADTFEEEDYSPFIGGVKLDPTGMDNLAAFKLAERASEILAKLDEDLDPGSEDEKNSCIFTKQSCSTLRTILHFRTLYFSLMASFQDVSATNSLEECLQLLPRAGPARPCSTDSEEAKDNCYFDSVICHKDMGSMPPRTVTLQSGKEAQEQFAKLLEDLLIVRRLGDCKSLEEMYRCLKVFSSRRANIVARSMVVDYLYSEDNKALFKYSYTDLIQNDMRDMGVPESMYKSDVCLDLIQKGLLRAIYDIMHVCTTNRSRKRRRIVHLLHNWRDIQHSLDMVHQQVYLADARDGKLPDKSPERLVNTLDIWALKWVIRLMSEFLLLGFELELYAIYEVDFILWYLDYISKSTADNRKRMDQFLQLEYVYEMAQLKAAKKKKKKKGSKIKQLKKTKQLDFTEFDKVEGIIYGYLAYGLLCFLLALRRENKHVDPDLKFGDNRTRFMQRTKPFEHMRPGRPSFDNFVQLSDVTKYNAAEVYDNAIDSFTKAKEAATLALKGLQRRPDLPQWHKDYQTETMRALARVALSNTLSVTALRALPTDKAISLKLDYSSHRSFPVVQQKSSSQKT